jgi:hypothetical protein
MIGFARRIARATLPDDVRAWLYRRSFRLWRWAADIERRRKNLPTSRLDPFLVSFRVTDGRERVDARQFEADPRQAVLLCFGQSNISNEGDPRGLHVPGPGVFNFNLFDGSCYVARDPLLGASLNRANVTTRIGDLLVRRGTYDRVLLVPIAYSGNYVADWVPGGLLHARLAEAAARLQAGRIGITHALWAQGEAESALLNYKGARWARRFGAMLAGLRALGIKAPVYVAQCTLCRGPPSERIREAQRGVIDRAKACLPGPDLDQLGEEYRWDGCHFSARGLERAAELWFDALTRAAPR